MLKTHSSNALPKIAMCYFWGMTNNGEKMHEKPTKYILEKDGMTLKHGEEKSVHIFNFIQF